MTKIRKGTSRREYTTQFTAVKPFLIIDNDIQSLLRQAITVAGFIRCYNTTDEADGYFDQLLPELIQLYQASEEVTYNGEMEPSQALLYAFLKQLQGISSRFNHRWHTFTEWYLDEILKVLPLQPLPHRVWIRLQKNSLHPVHIPERTAFLLQAEKKTQARFLTAEELYVNNIRLEKVLAYYAERNKKHLPAGYLNYVTSFRQQELSGSNLLYQAGIQIVHPSFLLREGKRHITLTILSSDDKWDKELENAISVIRKSLPGWSHEKIVFELFDQLFELSISSNEEWTKINEYIVDKKEEGIRIRFSLSEYFPESTPCNKEIHGFNSAHPVLRILLNPDNWLYGYSWLKHFSISSIKIHTVVEGIRNIKLYNDLGEVDTSKPFSLFGLNTEKACWFVVGNYEMSLKHLRSLSLHVQWDQLPDHTKGMAGYYQHYHKGINNHSFCVKAFYLNDYQWHPTTDKKHFSLFRSGRTTPEGNSLSDAPLAKDIRINNILPGNMPPIYMPEEAYNYSIHSRTGFIRFRLETPDIGFGEKYYRLLFANQLMTYAFRKKEYRN
ncbi:MAG: hypothetical protein LUD02_04285 [Tannerellaceae bacterium]|nr:hypothetical protein [Tannerellaceae bacterium]